MRFLVTLIANVGVALFQGLTFVLVARAMGVANFGKFSTFTSISTIAMPLAGLGMHNALQLGLLRGGRIDSILFGNARLAVAILGLFLVVIISSAYALAVGRNHVVLLEAASLCIVLISELLFYKQAEVLQHLFLGREKYDFAARVLPTISMVRLLAAMIYFFWITDHTLLVWAGLHLASTILGLATAYQICKHDLPTFDWSFDQAIVDLKVGAPIAASYVARALQSDADRAILQLNAGAYAAGVYSAAQRLVGMAGIASSTMVTMSIARLNRDYREGRVARSILVESLMPLFLTLAVAAAAGAALYAFAPYLVILLGPQYLESIHIIRQMSGTLPLAALSLFLLESLVAANAGYWRLVSQLAGAISGIAIVSLLASEKGVEACVFGSYISLAVSALVSLIYFFPNSDRNRQ